MNSMNSLPTLPNAFFHGSAIAFRHIDVTKGRGRKDFGRGFYMTFSVSQAVGMMHKKFRESISRRRDQADGVLSETLYRIEINMDILNTLRVKVFSSADMDWLNLILLCRQSNGVPHDFDVVIGPTADDDTNMALKYYYDGTYGHPGTEDAKRMLLRVLDVDRLGVQFFIGSQSVADRLVKKIEIVDWREYA